jgi:hypothetical protein
MKAPNSGIASLMAMRGRQGDNTLVHVNPMELRALNSMAPGGLTQNPSTGLPEAFKLKDILPALGAVAGSVFLGPLIGAGALAGGLGTGLGAAAGAAAAGGNREEIIGTGLMSGLTAGLVGGAGTAGKEAAQEAIKEGATQGAKTLAEQAAGTSTGGIREQLATRLLPDATIDAIGQSAFQGGIQAGINPAMTAGLEAAGGTLLKQAGAGGLSALATSPAFMESSKPVKGAKPIQSIRTEQRPTASREEIDRYIRQGGVMPTFFEPNPFVTQPGIYREDGGAVQTQTTDGNTIKGDSYVLDAFDVAAIGNGNTMAGADIIMNALGKSNDDSFSGLVVTDNSGVADDVSFNVRDGGEITKAMISGGEVVLAPDQVERAGGVENIDKFREELTQRVYKGEPSKVDSRFLQKLA